MKTNFFIIIILFFVLNSNAQQDYVYYSPADGLVQSSVTSLFQDSYGYIWIGTEGGVSKFDGFEFTNYTVFDGLADNYIVKILEDLDGHIWVLNRHSISVLRGGIFVSFLLDSANNFVDFDIDNDNNIWILDNNFREQNLYEFSDNKFTDKSVLSEGIWIRDLYFSRPNNTLLSITNKGVISLPEQNKFNYRENNSFEYCFNDQQGNSYFVSPDSIYSFNEQEIDTVYYKQSNFYIKTRLENGGFLALNKKNDCIYLILSENKIIKITQKQLINDVLVDNQENIWVGGETGLYRVTPFQNYLVSNELPNKINSIVEDNLGNIWFTSSNTFLPNADVLAYYSPFNVLGVEMKRASDVIIDQITRLIPQKSEKNLCFQTGSAKLADSSILFLTNQNFLLIFKNGKFTKESFDMLETQFCIFEDSIEHKIFLGTSNGLFVTNSSFSEQKVVNDYPQSNEQPITDIEKGRDGNIYFCTNIGIGIYDYKTVKFISQENLPMTGVMTIYKDYEQNLWFGALNGLFLYDYKTFRKINHPELAGKITAINSSSNNTLIVGTVKGIGLLNLEKLYQNNDTTIRFYDKSSGFAGVEVSLNGIFRDSKGNIWVATKSHIVKFNPVKLTENITPPITQITSRTYVNKNLEEINISDTTNILLYSENNINISFSGISYRAPNQVMFKYQLEGYDETQSPATKRRTVTYTNLSPGCYTFKVWASNESGIWNDVPSEWHFEIKEAVWQKTWFKYLLIFVIVLVTFLLTLAGVKFIYNRREHKHKIIDLQFHSFSNQLYPHFLYNAIANISGAIYTQDQDTAYDYTTKLTALIRQVQEDQKSIQRTLKNELVFIEKYIMIQKLRFNDRFDYKFRIDSNIDLNIKIPQMLIQTFVENAIKHGLEYLETGGKLLIEGKQNDKMIFFTVQDNGMGFDASKNMKKINSGRGLKIMNEILKLYNKRFKTSISYKIINLKKYKLNGTRIEIFIPK